MKRIFKIIGITLIAIVVGLLVFGFIINKPLPEGTTGTEADALANKMLKALNYETYQQTRFIEWSFRNSTYHYKWDKTNGIVTVKWSNKKVIINLSNPELSMSYTDNKFISDKKNSSLAEKALDKFNNDSFWLVAPYKVFDEGATRSTVVLDDGSKGLLITYKSGGSTPGDSYLWKLNSNGFPNAYQMWVDIIPFGGLEASWDDWITTESGTFFPKSHQLGPVKLAIENIKAYN